MKEITRRDFLKCLGATSVVLATASVLDITKWSDKQALADEKYTPIPDEHGNLTFISGQMGSGMTLAAVAMAYDAFKRGHKVYSNAKLNFPYQSFNPKSFESVSNSVVLIDNAWLYYDSRDPKMDAKPVYNLTTNNNMVIMTGPRYDAMPKQIRRMVDIRSVVYKTTGDKFVLRSLDCRTLNKYRHIINGKSYYELYNTREIIRV